ncbi:MAG: 30S ribosome-binding factor RbfA [Alphaproteobacteria bacterium]|nr:30S ribosome-binding factor RbfA [Alphaproteobacteria bacterium]MBP7761884.1 30S ribosome-binding factor RbfA [Alphaproteobacteria bacterium]MBP7904671.1 30S ribosome-binding factor RbfA [Alphaproteobacteria bacterium]
MKHRTSEPSQRQLRVGEQIRHILSETLQRGHFQSEILIEEAGLVTITEVRPSPDLKHARAYVMTLGGKQVEAILEALNDEARVFQKDIGRQSNLKFTPKIRFVTDDSFDQAQRIEELLRGTPSEKKSGD